MKKPNIIIFLADDLGYGDCSEYNGWIPMPRMEQMAREGLKFTDFHSNGAVCSPTRAALLTGRYQQRAGIEDVLVGRRQYASYFIGLEPEETSFARLLKDNGYATGLFGKWHLGHEQKHNPVNHGFDEFRGYLTGAVDYFTHSQDWWNGLEREDEEGYTTHLITQHSLDFIKRHKDEPFCLFVSHEAVHNPYQAPEESILNAPDPVREPPQNQWHKGTHDKTYIAMAQELDKGLGCVLDTVVELGLSEDTFVFFFSDNGGTEDIASNAPFRGFKADLWEGGHRVPAIAWWPGRIAPDTTTDALTLGMDLFPTFMELAGIAPSAARPVDGVSLVGLLTEQKPLPDRYCYWGYEMRGIAMRDKNWKFIISRKNTFPRATATLYDVDRHGLDSYTLELYDLDTDPIERVNRADEFPERVDRMAHHVKEWSNDVHCDHPLWTWNQLTTPRVTGESAGPDFTDV